MSLIDCLKKVGLSESDAIAVDANIDAGMSETEAVLAQIEVVNTDMSDILDKAEAAGATVNRAVEPTGQVFAQAQASGYEGNLQTEAAEWVAAVKKFGEEGMTKEARMERAEEMGFDGEEFYHATTKSFSEFSSAKIGSNTQHPTSHLGIFSVEVPSEASKYIESGGQEYLDGGNIIQILTKMENPYEMSASEYIGLLETGRLDPIEINNKVEEAFEGSGYYIEGFYFDSLSDAYELEFMRETPGDEPSQISFSELPSKLQDVIETGSNEYREYSEFDYRDAFRDEPLIQLMKKKRKELMSEGYDGIIISPDDSVSSDNWPELAYENRVVFNPYQIRSVNAAFDPDFKDSGVLLAQSQTPVFYSALTKAITEFKQKVAPAKQWVQLFTGDKSLAKLGVKAEEVEWSGVVDWLKEQKGSVTREELTDYLKSQEVQVEEVVKGGKSHQEVSELAGYSVGYDQDRGGYAVYDEDGEIVYDYDGGGDIEVFDSEAEAWEYAADKSSDYLELDEAITDDTGTKHADYQMPGEKEGYRELLLTMPVNSSAAFTSQHYDEENILAHVRFNQRTVEGKKTLFIEEIQSDWHQEGKKKGYRDENEVIVNVVGVKYLKDTSPVDLFYVEDLDEGRTYGKYRTEKESNNEADRLNKQHGEKDRFRSYELNASADYEVTLSDGNVSVINGISEDNVKAIAESKLKYKRQEMADIPPQAPFKKTESWAMLAFKRMTRYAAENGFEQIAWTPGEVQADRYDLSKQISRVTYTKAMVLRAYNNDGELALSKKLSSDDQVVDYIGKEPAKRLLDSPVEEVADTGMPGKGPSGFEITGEDLKIGGEGMSGFYDEILPKAVGKFAKKFGAKVSTGKSETGQEVWTLPLTDKLKESALQGLPLFQESEDRPRATVRFTDTESIVRLSNASDLSSFLHESAHIFLHMEMQFAANYGITEDQKSLLKWLGVESFDQLMEKDSDGKLTDAARDKLEKFAETFEVYLREGKAPSLKLREAFAAFRRWLPRIYVLLSDPRISRADLNDEVRGIFDRLLASEAEIEQATANPAYDQFFRSKEQAGMTDAEWQAYQKKVEAAKNKAQMTLDEKLLAELRKRRTKEWKAEKQPLVDEEIKRLEETPTYQVISDIKSYPMDYEAVKEILGFDKQPGKLIGKIKKGGIDPDEYSALYEFPDVVTMLQAILDAPPLRKAAEEAAEARMIAKYGDILNDGTIEEEAREAVHNDAQKEVLLSELRALNKKAGNRSTINRAYLEAEARLKIQSMKYHKIQPGKFYRAEIRAAKKAVTAETEEAVLEAKVQQVANHYLYREAVKTRTAMVKQRKAIRGFETRSYSPKHVAPKYAQNIRMLAASYNMRQGKAAQALDVETIVMWMTTQLDDPNNFIDLSIYDSHIAEMIQDKMMKRKVDYSLPKFDDMTAGELKGVYDQLRHMRYVGGKLSEATKNELVAERESKASSIKKYSRKEHKPTHEEGKYQGTKESFLEFGYSHRRIGGIMETLDGFEEGPMGEEYETISKASDKELELTDKMADLFKDALEGVHSKINRYKQSTITKADGKEWKLSHRARFVLGLNWGNDGNKTTVLEGLNAKFKDEYTEADVVTMLSKMSVEELESLNKIWAAKEQLWPELSAVEVRRKGVAPMKIEATPTMINGVYLTGGHCTLHYRVDPSDSARKDITVDRSLDSTIKIKTASSAFERVGSGGRLVDLEISHLFSDIQESIHYIAYAELSDRLNSIFKGVENPVVSAIMSGYGSAYYDNVVNTLSVITQPEDPTKGLWKALKYVRTNLTYGYLIGSIRNILQQPIAITNSFAQLGFGRTLQGALEFYRNPVDNWRKIRKLSAFMKHRTELVNREAREQLLKIDSIHPKLGAMKNLAFLPQTFMDSLIAYPTWMAALNEYKREHPGSSESKAIHYADEMVAKTIGSGLAKDVGAILNKGEAEKQITFMGTFFNLTWNLHVENAQLLTRGKIGHMEYARRLGWIAIAPALLSMWILDDVEDDDEQLVHALKEIGFYNMSSLFLVRDLAGGLDGFKPSIPGLKFVDGIVRVSGDVKGLVTGDEELDMELTASLIRGLQPLFPLPVSGQVARTLEGAADPKQGVYGMLVEGKERNN